MKMIPTLAELNKIMFDEEEIEKYLIIYDVLTTEGRYSDGKCKAKLKFDESRKRFEYKWRINPKSIYKGTFVTNLASKLMKLCDQG